MKESYKIEAASQPAEATRLEDEATDEASSDIDDEEQDESGEKADERRRGAVSTRLIDALPVSPLLWNAIAAVCLLGAIAFMFYEQTDAAFVAAALGVVAWFINVRNGFRHGDIEGGSLSERGGRRDEKILNENE
ncbi:MAG TPA: hypothetical protein VGB73_00635 [Pyrinomonadaceae bacterium]